MPGTGSGASAPHRGASHRSAGHQGASSAHDGGIGDDVIVADVLVLACGRLTEPTIPRIAGLETFPGPLFHSARWDHSADLAGARVGVVGTGASAVQLVPELARTAAHVTLFQRTPAWIVPRGGDAYSDADRARFADRPRVARSAARRPVRRGRGALRVALGRLRRRGRGRSGGARAPRTQVADPALRAALTPDYAFGCKRVLLSDDFYPAVASDAVTLEPAALAAVEGSTLVAADGTRHEVDALVLATGFASTRQPYAELVAGENGQTLAEHWSGGMTSFASTVVAGFPNLFVLNGPNASLGHSSSVLMIEEQVGYVTRVPRRPLGPACCASTPTPKRRTPTRSRAAAASTRWMTGGCRNWYVDERSGRLTLLWPGTVDAFRARLARADGSEFLPTPDAATAAGTNPDSHPDREPALEGSPA